MISIFAQMLRGVSFYELAKWIIVIAAIVAIVFIVLRVMNVSPPPWLIQIFWVVVVAFVGILAIGLVASM